MLKTTNNNKEKVPLLMAATVLTLLIVRFAFFALSPHKDIIGVIPDDAFYYIQMAFHRSRDGTWTFDGTAPATGFHFLHGYFLVLIFKLFPDADWIDLYWIISISSCLAISTSVYFLGKAVSDLYRAPSALASALPFLSFPIIMQSTAMMEAWLVIFFSSLTVFLIVKQRETSTPSLTALCLIGILGSLSRSDYGMLPGILFVSIFTFERFRITPAVARISAILFGAIIGLSLLTLHNYLISGQLTQASAQIKLLWSSISGHSIQPAIQLFLSISLPSIDLIARQSELALLAILLLTVTACSIATLKSVKTNNHTLPAALLVGCFFTIVGYIAFYRQNSSALQPWYASNFITPIAIVTAAIFHFLTGRWNAIPTGLAFTVFLLSGLKNIFYIPWPHQSGMMEAGAYIRDLDKNSRFAAWNAGIISYFSGKPVINIDGLTNDEILPYIKNNRLISYLKEKNINYIVDYKEMIDSKSLRQRGGYDDKRIFRCITPLRPIDGTNTNWANSRLTLFKVSIDCL